CQEGQKHDRSLASGNTAENEDGDRHPRENWNRADDFNDWKCVVAESPLPAHEQPEGYAQHGGPEERLRDPPNAPEYVLVILGCVDGNSERRFWRGELGPNRYGSGKLIEARNIEVLGQQIPRQHQPDNAEESDVWRGLRQLMSKAKERDPEPTGLPFARQRVRRPRLLWEGSWRIRCANVTHQSTSQNTSRSGLFGSFRNVERLDDAEGDGLTGFLGDGRGERVVDRAFRCFLDIDHLH